jgi:GT2 family glycosyltransferase
MEPCGSNEDPSNGGGRRKQRTKLGALSTRPEPTVSIVIITHSVRRELERCLDSIRRHAGVPTQIVLVDNASTDDTCSWVAREHADVVLVRLDRNLGVAAREPGLARASGTYTMFLDSDAALTEGALPAMVEALEQHAAWGLLGPRLEHEDGSLQLSCRRFPPLVLPLVRRPPLDRWFGGSRLVQRHLMEDVDHSVARPVPYVLGACQLFRTSLARKAGAFDERIFYGPDDIDWCIRIRDAGGAVVYFPEATVVHTYRRITRRRPFSRASLRHLQAFAYFRWKYRWRWPELHRLERELDAAAGPRR